MAVFTKEVCQKKLNTWLAAEEAIATGQSYQIGSRKLTRADLSMLRTMKKELQAEVNAEGSSSLLDNTYVAFFDGR